MSRTLVFTGTATTQGALLPFDPWSATAAQVALILAQERMELLYEDEDNSDAALIAYVRNRVCLPGHWSPGAWELTPDHEDDPEGDVVYQAYLALLTPRVAVAA